MPPRSKALTEKEVFALPPMIFGAIPDPLAVYGVLDPSHHIAGVNFEVQEQPWRFNGP